jgi:hypothetical protein
MLHIESHPSPGSAVELSIYPSSVGNDSFFSVKFSNVPSNEFLLLGEIEGSIDANSVTGAIEIPLQRPGQESPIRTDHSIPANTITCHFHPVHRIRWISL